MPKSTQKATDLGDRTKYIGASDVPAILGVNRWKSSYDVWLEKTGRVDPDLGFNRAIDAGIRLESVIVDWAEEQIGKITRVVEIPKQGIGFPLTVHLDGVLEESGEPVEAKSSGLFSPLAAEWGEEHTDQVPDYINVQTQTQLYAVGKDINYVPALLGGRGFQMFHVTPNAKLIQIICDRCGEFWLKNVIGDTPPDSLPSLKMAKRVKRKPESVEIDGALILEYVKARDHERAATKAKKAAQAAILKALGDAEVGKAPGVGTATYFEQSTAGYYVEAKTYRVLRTKKV